MLVLLHTIHIHATEQDESCGNLSTVCPALCKFIQTAEQDESSRILCNVGPAPCKFIYTDYTEQDKSCRNLSTVGPAPCKFIYTTQVESCRTLSNMGPALSKFIYTDYTEQDESCRNLSTVGPAPCKFNRLHRAGRVLSESQHCRSCSMQVHAYIYYRAGRVVSESQHCGSCSMQVHIQTIPAGRVQPDSVSKCLESGFSLNYEEQPLHGRSKCTYKQEGTLCREVKTK
ncbi:hypothetical protein BSL78_01053 [Apostichopus japonicus]|uniref:Uncharacterized protein n=1 Tax=Stichopus japonicus TaxID=307972 RepID=A0A2G8LPA4_STIJA|nr:hypothetical protein BSL78_01053 [Apostichopus japonicus]